MAAQTPILSAQQNASMDLATAVQHAISHASYNDETMLPAIVISYDRDDNLATVQPLIQIENVSGGYQSRHKLTQINVLSLGGGGFHVSFPLNEGDLGWIVAGDRDLAIFRQELKESPPNTSIPKTFANGLFVPDVMRKYTINSEDASAMVIQSIDGETRISIRDDNIKITAPTKFLVDCPASEFTGNVTIDKNLIVTGDTTIAGLTTANGGFTATEGSAATLPSSTTVDGISVLDHGHEQQNDGSGRTAGGMII